MQYKPVQQLFPPAQLPPSLEHAVCGYVQEQFGFVPLHVPPSPSQVVPPTAAQSPTPQLTVGGGTQAPDWQVAPLVQTCPHAPQLLLSFNKFTQAPLQLDCPAEQPTSFGTHSPPLH